MGILNQIEQSKRGLLDPIDYKKYQRGLLAQQMTHTNTAPESHYRQNVPFGERAANFAVDAVLGGDSEQAYMNRFTQDYTDPQADAIQPAFMGMDTLTGYAVPRVAAAYGNQLLRNAPQIANRVTSELTGGLGSMKPTLEMTALSGGKKKSYPMAKEGEWWGEGTYKQAGGRLDNMSPDEFLSRSKPLDIDDLARENIDELKSHIQSGSDLDPLTLYADDVTDVRASDGRHRAIAAKELGIDSVPVVNYTKTINRNGEPLGLLDDIPDNLKRQSGDGLPTPKTDDMPEMLKRQSGSGLLDELPMDEASRMARAKEMGSLPDDYYHGTAKEGYVDSTDIKQFEKEKIGDRWSADDEHYFFTNNKTEANYYANSDRDYYNKGEGGGAVYPVKLMPKNPLIIDDAFLKKEGMTPIGINDDTVNFWDNYQGLIKEWETRGGHDGVILKDSMTKGLDGKPVELVAIRKPNQIRSKFAKFDPKKKGSANLLAGGLLGAIGLNQTDDK